jgi:8-oxo-dGTP diphosphatase
MTYHRKHGMAIVDTSKGILVVSGRSKLFILPGGATNKGESRKSAAIRELREETGLKVDSCKFLFYHKGSKHRSYRGGHFRNQSKVFLIKTKGHARPRHEVKHIAYYNSRGNIRISHNTKLIIEKYLEMKKEKTLIGFLRKILNFF